MDVTRERISRILELTEILLSIQTGFSLVNAAVACAILESISGLEPSSVIMPELPNNKPHRSSKQSHAEDHTEQIEATSGEDHRLLSPTIFNIFLERIIKDALEDHEGTVSIWGRTITNLCFADDIDGLVGEEEELAILVECLNKASTAYGMEISAEKTKLVTNNTSDMDTEISK